MRYVREQKKEKDAITAAAAHNTRTYLLPKEIATSEPVGSALSAKQGGNGSVVTGITALSTPLDAA